MKIIQLLKNCKNISFADITNQDVSRWYYTRFPQIANSYSRSIADVLGGSLYRKDSLLQDLLLGGSQVYGKAIDTDRIKQLQQASIQRLFEQKLGRPLTAQEKASIEKQSFNTTNIKDLNMAKMGAEALLWGVPAGGVITKAIPGAVKVGAKISSVAPKLSKVGGFLVDNAVEQVPGLAIEAAIEEILATPEYQEFLNNPNISESVKTAIIQHAAALQGGKGYRFEHDIAYAGDGVRMPSDDDVMSYMLGNPSKNNRKYDMQTLSKEGQAFFDTHVLGGKGYIPGESHPEFHKRIYGTNLPSGKRTFKMMPSTTPGFNIGWETSYPKEYYESQKRLGELNELFAKLPESDRKIIDSRIHSGWISHSSPQGGFSSTDEYMVRDFGNTGKLDLNKDGNIYLNGQKIDLSKLNEQQLQTLQYHILDNGSNLFTSEDYKTKYEQKTGNARKRSQHLLPHRTAFPQGAPVESKEWTEAYHKYAIENNPHLKSINQELNTRFPIKNNSDSSTNQSNVQTALDPIRRLSRFHESQQRISENIDEIVQNEVTGHHLLSGGKTHGDNNENQTKPDDKTQDEG